MFHLDHFALGAQDVGPSAEELAQRTGLGSYFGGEFANGLRNWIFPLGGDVYLEVEGGGRPGDPAAEWFERATRDGAERWMFWCLRADTRAELEEVAERLGSRVHTAPGRREPDGTQRLITCAPAPEVAAKAWRQGLPNWYYRADPESNPARREVTGDRTAQEVAWLEVAGDRELFREYIGAETFDRLPLRFVTGAPGLHAVAVRTTAGEEIVIRRAPADQEMYPA